MNGSEMYYLTNTCASDVNVIFATQDMSSQLTGVSGPSPRSNHIGASIRWT